MTTARYAALLLPSANRVYAAASTDLLAAELEILASAAGAEIVDPRVERIADVAYVTFTVDDLDDRTVAYLANASALYALFRFEAGALHPVPAPRLDRLDDDLVTIQKYAGKTNEQFTRLLLNVTVAASGAAGQMLDRPLRVLDPVCGRGSTLNQALLYGYHAAGIDVDTADVEAYATFVRTYLPRKRLKHTVAFGPVRRDRKVVARRLEATIGLTREAFKAGDVRELDVVAADTRRCGEFFRRGSFDVVVGDLPYGVQHGSRSAGGDLQRGPLDLLRTAVPAWTAMLRPGGTIGLSWNTHVAAREEAAGVLADHGLEVLDDGAWTRLRHRVDQSIDRDVLVARRAPRPRA
ncbi:TRM11 family SAM-dependent methyltransferase [Isoptericola jiangsuensis]|uniref:TRM11 family SAM-dependent methyltransferase n=1 Tax=Isoptericola jiangsuensis TaxID=548579 RepID=UPI003AAB8B0F